MAGILDPSPFLAAQKASNPVYNPFGPVDIPAGIRSVMGAAKANKEKKVADEQARQKLEAELSNAATTDIRNMAQAGYYSRMPQAPAAKPKTTNDFKWEYAMGKVRIGDWDAEKASRFMATSKEPGTGIPEEFIPDVSKKMGIPEAHLRALSPDRADDVWKKYLEVASRAPKEPSRVEINLDRGSVTRFNTVLRRRERELNNIAKFAQMGEKQLNGLRRQAKGGRTSTIIPTDEEISRAVAGLQSLKRYGEVHAEMIQHVQNGRRLPDHLRTFIGDVQADPTLLDSGDYLDQFINGVKPAVDDLKATQADIENALNPGTWSGEELVAHVTIDAKMFLDDPTSHPSIFDDWKKAVAAGDDPLAAAGLLIMKEFMDKYGIEGK